MQNAGLQYGEGVTPVQESPFVSAPVQINPSNSTSSLRQFRKKDNVEKAAGVSGPLSAANSAGQDTTNSSHVARVAPHNHYPHKQNEYFRYPPQYQEYSSPPVKYSEIAEPSIQPIAHLDHLPPSVLSKHKEKEYVEMCNIPQQGHLNKPYPEHQFNSQQSYPPEMTMHHQYMHKEPQGSQIHSPYKPESQYIPKEGAYNHQISPYLKYNIPQSRNYAPLDNSSLTPFQRMDPHLARSFMAEHHHIREFPTEYSPMEQSRMYAQKQRYYPTPLPPSNSTYPPNYPHRNIPAQQYNYPSCNYPRSAQMNSSMGRYAMNMERSISPRRTYSENMDMTMNFAPVPQKIPANYPNYPAYAQHYQQRRPTAVPQEYYHHQQHPHPRAHPQYMPNHHPQEIPENHVASNNIRQYLENWAEEEPTPELPTMENSKYISRINPREEPNEVYVINASELPQYLENGVPLIASENGQYIFKSNVSIDNTGAIKIIDKTVENTVLPPDTQERVVSLHIIENPKTDCLINRPQHANQENQVATNQVSMDMIAGNSSHANMDNAAHRTFNQPGYNTNRMNVHQVSPMTQNNSSSINLSVQSNTSNSPQQIARSSSGSPQKIPGNVDNDQLKIQVLSYNEVPQNSCIVMPATQNRLNFDESLLPNPVPCDLKQKKSDFEEKNASNDTNSVIANVMNEEAILKEAHEELDKIVQDTLTSTNIHMPLESCNRSQIPKIEEKCVEENINSRIPDYLNLDLESNTKDSTECPIINLEGPLENEAIMDLSTTSRRTSKSENEDQELDSSIAIRTTQETKDKNEPKTEKNEEETNDNKDVMDKDPIKHMPLIFDGFEEQSSDKNKTDVKVATSQDEDTLVETKKEEQVKEDELEKELKKLEEGQSVSDLSKSINQVSSSKESPTVTANGDMKEKEPEEKLKMDIILRETLEEIDHVKSTKARKDETSENNEAKEDKSNENIEGKSNETDIDSKTNEENKEREHQEKDKEVDKIEKEVESSEQTNATEATKSGIKRKRIFSVDDIIYRIGSTSSHIQNPFSDASDSKNENEKSNIEEMVIEQNENKKFSKNEESDLAISEVAKEDLRPQVPNEKQNEHPQEKKETDVKEKEEDEEKVSKECEELPENTLQDHKETSNFEDSDRISPKIVTEGSEEDSKPIDEEVHNSALCQNEENTETNESDLEAAKEVLNSVNNIESTSENSRCELESPKVEENNEENVMESCVDKNIEKLEETPIENNSADIPDSEEKEESNIIHEEKPIDYHKTRLQESETPTEIETQVLIVPEKTVSIVEVEIENNFEQKKIEILSNEILVQENKEEISERPCFESHENNHDMKTENLKRNLSETDPSNEDTADDGTISEISPKKFKLDDSEFRETIDHQEVVPEYDKNNSKELELDIPVTNPCRFSVIQRIKTIHRAVTNIGKKQQSAAVSDNETLSSPMEVEERKEEIPPSQSKKTEDEVINKDKDSNQELEELTTHISDAQDSSTSTANKCTSEEKTPSIKEEIRETTRNPPSSSEVNKDTPPLLDLKNAENVVENSINKPFHCDPLQNTIIDEVHMEEEAQNEHLPSSEETAHSEHILTSEERIHTEHILSSEDMAHTEHIPASGEAYDECIPSSEEIIHTEHISSPEEKTHAEHIPTLEEETHSEVVYAEHIPSSEEAVHTEDMCSPEGSPHTEHIPTSEGGTYSEHLPSSEEIVHSEHVCVSEESAHTEHMLTSEERVYAENNIHSSEEMVHTEDMCRREESAHTEHIPTSEVGAYSEDTPSSEEMVHTEHMCISEESVHTEHMLTSEERVYAKHNIPSSEEIVHTEDMCSQEESAHTEHIPTSEVGAYSEHIPISEENVYAEHILSSEEEPHPEHISTSEGRVHTEHIPTSKDQKSLKISKEEFTFEQRFVEPLLKNKAPEISQKNENQEEKPPVEDCQYRSVLKIEENTVLLEICGELVEISVNQINGKKVITVVPISNSTTVDINDNYEHTDRTQTCEQLCASSPVESEIQNDIEMPELQEERSVGLDEDDQDKNIPVLDKMISSSGDLENVIRNEEISSTQTEIMGSSTEEIFEDIILNENEIIIGDESLEEEINLDLESDEQPPREKPILCTKAAKKSYEETPGTQQPKPHSSLREFRKIKNKPEQQIEKITPDGQNNGMKGKKHLKGSTRTSTRQKNVSDQKGESQIALQELVKQRKMRKEKIRLKYPYVIDNAQALCENPQLNNAAFEKIGQDKEVKSEIRKVPKIASDIVKIEMNQVSSIVHKVKPNEMKRRESSEIHGTKAKCKDKIRRKSVEEVKEKIHVVASVIVKEPYSNKDADKTKTDEKPSSTSQIFSNPGTTAKEVSNQNFQEGRTSNNMEVAKNTNVQEKHSKFQKTSAPRDLSLTKNINEHYLSRKDHSNLKKKLSIQEYNSRKRKMEESKVASTPEKIVKLEESTKLLSLAKENGRPSTIYSGRQFENVSDCVKDPRRLQFMNSENSTLLRSKSEQTSSSKVSNISSRTSSSGSSSTSPAIIVNPLLNLVSTNNQSRTQKNPTTVTSLGETKKNSETHKRKVSFDDNVQINEVHTTQTKVCKSRQDSSSSYCEVTSSCSDSFEERGLGDGLHDDKIENTRLEYQNNLVRRFQNSGKFENNWEDSNSPKDCITDAFSDCFLEKNRLETMKNTSKSKLIIDINDFDTSLINNELKGSYNTNPNLGEEKLKNYKEEVDIKLNSLNIQIPKTIKNRVINEDDLLMHKFLRKEQLNSDEIKQIRRIIYFKKKIQQLTQQNIINNNKSGENKYEIKKSPETSTNKDLKLQLKKVDGKIKKKKKRFRNLYSNSPETSENEVQQTAGEFSVYEGENISGVKLIFKRKTDFLNLQPVVRLRRYRYIDMMAKKLKFE